jgi:hypothetical protein
MKLHVLVEGPSEVVFLDEWLPRLLKNHTHQVYVHQGKGTLPKAETKPKKRPRGEEPEGADRKRGLLDQLPQKLRAFGDALNPATDAVVVLVDADTDDPERLAADLAALYESIPKPERPLTLFRVATEELEAFYLGDLAGIAKAYPDHDKKLASSYKPDSICGTAELFDKVIGGMGAMDKVSWAEEMGPRLTVAPAKNRSPSFRRFVTGLGDLVATPPPPTPTKRPYRHAAKTPKDGGVKR